MKEKMDIKDFYNLSMEEIKEIVNEIDKDEVLKETQQYGPCLITEHDEENKILYCSFITGVEDVNSFLFDKEDIIKRFKQAIYFFFYVGFYNEEERYKDCKLIVKDVHFVNPKYVKENYSRYLEKISLSQYMQDSNLMINKKI